MSTYIFGDLQGCYTELQQLLEKINYNPNTDRLGFVGDLVNRGPDSLACLRFIKNLKDPLVVLGNHDFYLLALGYHATELKTRHTLQPILEAPDCAELLDWLRHQPLFHYDAQNHYAMAHAGVPPQWNLQQAQAAADEVHAALLQNDVKKTLDGIFGDHPVCWNEALTGMDRLRYIVNAFTRMRFCDQKGCLELKEKRELQHALPQYKPWFQWPNKIDCDIFYGHWAALKGESHQPKHHALDTGCAWGAALTAIRVEDRKRFSVPAIHKSE